MKAEKTTITEQVVTEVKSEAIVLTLSPSEAQFLMDLTGLIGGSPATTRRFHADNLRTALYDAGVHGSSPLVDVDATHRRIYFK